MARIGRRDAVAAAIIALTTGIATTMPVVDTVRGLSIDALTGMRWHLFGPMHQLDLPDATVRKLSQHHLDTGDRPGAERDH